MSKKLVVQFVAAVVASVFAGGLWISGTEPQLAWLRFFSLAVWVALLGLLVWEKYLWRLRLVQKWTQSPRDLRGTWQGTLRSLWIDPETGESPNEKTVYLVVRQDASSLSVVLLTNESQSSSSLAKVTDDNTVASLDYMYLNRPDPTVEHRSRMHHGSSSMTIIGRPATRLRGRYWTDRDSRGELDFTLRKPGLVDGYGEAATLFAD